MPGLPYYKIRGMVTALLPVLALLLSGGQSRAFVRFDFEQRYLVIPGRYTKDRCFIKRGDEWHCFMIAGNDSSIGWQVPGNEVSFGHVSTRDFRRWVIHPDVLSIGLGRWNERNIWAPDIVRWGSGYRMYYTGVDSSIVQRMGMAESTDLFDWRPLSLNPIYNPDTTWAEWGEGRWSNCRDPDVFILRDTLHVLNTVSVKGGTGAVDHAVSTDGIEWNDLGPLFVNDSELVLESVQLVEQGGYWYLFFNEQGVLGVSVIRAESFNGPWIKADRIIVSQGQAQEIFGDIPNALISRHISYRAGEDLRYAVKIDSLYFDAEGFPYIGKDRTFWDDWSPLALGDPDPCMWEVGFEIFETDSAFAYQPTFGENPLFRGEDYEIGVVGNSWIGTGERYRGPLTSTDEGSVVGEEAVGGVRSRDFTITGRRISFLIGGGYDPERLVLALCDSRDHRVLFGESGPGREELEPRLWRTDSLYGRRVYLKIIDASPVGHLNLDEIVESGEQSPPSDTPFPGYLYNPYPNPFSEDVSLPVRLDRKAPLEVEIYDASGRLVRRIFSGDVGRGIRVFHWDGMDDEGRSTAAGAYFLNVRAGRFSRSVKILRVR